MMSEHGVAAELPDAPKPTKQFAVNVGTTERYSLTKSDFEIAMYVAVDYRIHRNLRIGVSYGQSFLQPVWSHWPKLNQSVTVGANYKVREWGKVD